jgi:hypothetical protein
MGPLGEQLMAAQDEIDPSVFPARFTEARGLLRRSITAARDAGIGDATLAAVLFSEALPRLVDLYGPSWVATMLTRLSDEIAAGNAPNMRQQ